MIFKHLPGFIWSLFLDILAIAAIFYAVGPFATWYLAKSPAIGVDLYNSINHVSQQLRHFSLPFNGFNDTIFAGFPQMFDFPHIPYYLMVPFAAIWGIVGIQVFAIFSLFLFIFCCYLLFFKLSANWGVSIFLAVLVLLSVNIYGDLTWAGSLPYFLSQSFLPLALLFAVRYFEEANFKNLGLLAVVVAVAFLIHPLSTSAYIIPATLLVIISGGVYAAHPILATVKRVGFFFLIFILGSLMVTARIIAQIPIFSYSVFSVEVTSSAVGLNLTDSATVAQVAQYFKDQIPLLWQHTHTFIYIALAAGLALFLVAFPLSRGKRRSILILAFALIALYCGLLPVVNLSGKFSFFAHDPYRAFWQFPVALSALTAAAWGFFLRSLKEKLWTGKFLKTMHVSLGFLITVALAFGAYLVFTKGINEVISTIDGDARLIEFSSAFPESLSVNLQDRAGLAILKKQLVPSFMDPGDKNKRLYTADQTVNLWWSSFFEVPLARGYVDPPVTNRERGGVFWLDIAMTGDILVNDFMLSEQVALSNTLFLIDWNGIYYFEGGREGTKGPSPPASSYLLTNHIFDKNEEVTTYGRLLKYQTESGMPEFDRDIPEKLNFFKVADKFTSPILYATNASPIVFFGTRASYEDFLRALAAFNLNSKRLIPVYGGEEIANFSLSELRLFEAVFANQYKSGNASRAFANLEKYVKDGGKVFIDTGSEVAESDGEDLPLIFPFEASVKKGQGREWDLRAQESEIVKDVDVSRFGPLVWQEDEWKVSTPKGDLREGSKVLLSHGGKPVLVERSLGTGRVIWSGVNLIFHYNHYKSDEEAKLIFNILGQFTDLSEKEPIAASVEWRSPEEVKIEVAGKARGILFKEQSYDGWQAQLVSGSRRRLPFYVAGPSFPGFMYVPLSRVEDGQAVAVAFNFSGSLVHWFQTIINGLVILFVVEYAAFDGRIYGRKTYGFFSKMTAKMFGWWNKEEE